MLKAKSSYQLVKLNARPTVLAEKRKNFLDDSWSVEELPTSLSSLTMIGGEYSIPSDLCHFFAFESF